MCRRGLLLVIATLLVGCSAVRLAYNQAPDIAYWWLDGYVDFNGQQSLVLRDALDGWFRWHRRQELPQYASLLARARAELAEPATPEQACRWFDELNLRFDAAFEQALPGLADAMRRLTPQQLAHLEHKYAEGNEESTEDYLQPDPEERIRARLDRALDRIESVYGRMSRAQRERIAVRAAQTPFDPTRWLAERRARQQDTLQTLARLSADQASAEEAQVALRGLMQRIRRSPHDDYRTYQQRLIQFNCAFAAEVHNLTTPEQRAHAAGKLKGWEGDVRALALKSGS